MNLKNTLLGIAIMILTIFVVVYGIGTFYSKPVYENYCPSVKTAEFIESDERCVEIGGMWNNYEPRINCIEGQICPEGYCDRDYFCRQDFEKSTEVYYKNLFLITLPLGVAIIIFSALIFGLEFVGAGLMGGGVGAILYGVGGYWRYSENFLKFILSLIGLSAIIWFSYWFTKRNQKKK